MATKKCEEFKLNACKDGDYERSFRSLERKGFINVEGKGQMRILRVKGDGNCQFRSVAVLIAGDDDEENHKTVRKVALQNFETYDDAKLRPRYPGWSNRRPNTNSMSPWRGLRTPIPEQW